MLMKWYHLYICTYLKFTFLRRESNPYWRLWKYPCMPYASFIKTFVPIDQKIGQSILLDFFWGRFYTWYVVRALRLMHQKIQPSTLIMWSVTFDVFGVTLCWLNTILLLLAIARRFSAIASLRQSNP